MTLKGMSGRQLIEYLCTVCVHLSYIPLQLSPAFIMTCLFEDEALTNDFLLGSFRFYVSSDDRDIVANCIAGNVHPNDDELIDFLSSFKCYRNPTEQNIREIILKIAHQEIVHHGLWPIVGQPFL